MKICPQCGKQYPQEETVCQADGSRLAVKSEDPYIGYHLANYEFIKSIGKGGFGVVYLAKHVELGHLVAVKVLKKQFITDNQLVERFRREARVSSQIAHENVVHIVDFGYDEEIGFYYIMEYLDGQSLTDLMKSYPRGMPLERLLPIFRQICSALDQAHSLNVVHRDLKPSNIILIKRFNQDDVPKILDFGIAKVLQGEEGSNMTVTGQIVGSPRFMSPEQARGRHSEVDARSDIYSLGVILFWTLTGRLPFESKQLARLLYMHVKMPPPTLASVAPQHAFSPQLEAVVQAALSKRKDDRPASAGELYRRLENACQQPGISPILDVYDDPLAPDSSDLTVRVPRALQNAQLPGDATVDSSQDIYPTGATDLLEYTQVDSTHEVQQVNAELEAMLAAHEDGIDASTVHLGAPNHTPLPTQDLTTDSDISNPSVTAFDSSPVQLPRATTVPPPHPLHEQTPSSPLHIHSPQSPPQTRGFSWRIALLVLLAVILLLELALVGFRLWQKHKRADLTAPPVIHATHKYDKRLYEYDTPLRKYSHPYHRNHTPCPNPPYEYGNPQYGHGTPYPPPQT